MEDPIIVSAVLLALMAACVAIARKRRQDALARAGAADAQMTTLANATAEEAKKAEEERAKRKAEGRHWDFFISHMQKETKDIAADLYHTLHRQHGLTAWLDVKMPDRSELAMEDGVRGSDKVLVIVSETYFTRPFCLKELRWAQQYNKEVVVAIPVELKTRIGEILQQCPSDLRSIGAIDFKMVDRSDVDHFELCVRKLIDTAAARRLAHPTVPVPTPGCSPAVLFEDVVGASPRASLVKNRNTNNNLST